MRLLAKELLIPYRDDWWRSDYYRYRVRIE